MERDLRLRPLGSPAPIRVRTDREDRPVEVWTRQGAVKVAAIQEIWRLDDEWWRQPISRLYYRTILESGKILTLYRDLSRGSWHTQ